MDFFCVDAPPPEITFELAQNDDSSSELFETVSDESHSDDSEACLDLRELGLMRVTPAMAGRAWRSAKLMFEAYRDARAAADVGGAKADEAFEAARARLLQAACAALTGFPGWEEVLEARA